jgi:hypothetical protein
MLIFEQKMDGCTDRYEELDDPALIVSAKHTWIGQFNK